MDSNSIKIKVKQSFTETEIHDIETYMKIIVHKNKKHVFS